MDDSTCMVESGDIGRADIFKTPHGDLSDEDSGVEDSPGSTDNLSQPELANPRVT